MNVRCERLSSDEGGFGIIAAVIVGFVVMTGAVTMLSIGVQQNKVSAEERDRERAFAAAEAGVHEAMSLMSYDPSNCPGLGGVPVTTRSLPGGGEFEFAFELPVDGAHPTGDPRFACTPGTVDRYIVARGWVPSKAAPNAQRRQVEQQIKLQPQAGFKAAFFASPGGITGAQHMDITGDVYSAHDLTLDQHTRVNGSVIGQQRIDIANNSGVVGDIWARGNIALSGPQITVQRDVKTSGGERRNAAGAVVGVDAGDIANQGTIEQKALAPGAITGGGEIAEIVPGPVSPPPVRTVPLFDPASVGGTLYASSDEFSTFANSSAFTGTYRVTDGSNQIVLNGKPKFLLAGGERSMVVADGPIKVSGDVGVTTTEPTTLVLVSLASSTASAPVIELTQLQKFPPNVTVVLFAPYGCVSFNNQKDFDGAVYAKCISTGQKFTMRHRDPGVVPGFDWTMSSATSFDIEAYTFREVAFEP